MKIVCLLLLLASGPGLLFAQKTVLHDVTIIDGTGAPAKPHTNLIMSGDRINSIGNVIPADARVIDMKGKYIMPEIICGHAHLGNLKDTIASAANYTPDNIRRQLQKYQDYGIGAVLSMGTEQPVGLPTRDSSRAGLIAGATMYSAIYGFGVPGGMPPGAGFTHVYRPATAEEATRQVQELAALHPDVIKIWVDNSYGQFQTMREEVYKVIISEAHRHGIRVAAHLYHLTDARKLVAAGIDIMAHSIRDAEIDDELIAEMKKNHVIYIPTLSLDEYFYIYGDDPYWLHEPFFRTSLEPGVYGMITSPGYKERLKNNPITEQEKTALQIALKNLIKLHKAGIVIALGSDSGATPVRTQGFSEHLEMELMVQAGLTPLEAIEVATLNGARLLKIDKDRGTLVPGKKADFIVLNQDPLNDIRNTHSILAVWKDGKKVSNGPVTSSRSVTP